MKLGIERVQACNR